MEVVSKLSTRAFLERTAKVYVQNLMNWLLRAIEPRQEVALLTGVVQRYKFS